MRALQLPELSPEAIKGLDRLYRTARDPRVRMRAQMILLAAEKSLLAEEIAEIVRTDAQTVRRWLKRYQTEGLNGLADAPRPGGPRKVTDDYLTKLVEVARRSPNDVGLPDAHWTAERLTHYMAAHTDIEVHPETVRLCLKAAGISLKDPAKSAPAKAPPHTHADPAPTKRRLPM